MEVLFTFPSTSHAIFGEDVLLENSIEVRVMPLPATIRAGCGLCLRIAPQDGVQALGLLKSNGVEVEAMYTRTLAQGKSVYIPFKEDIIDESI